VAHHLHSTQRRGAHIANKGISSRKSSETEQRA
jgi:hypothetical protein